MGFNTLAFILNDFNHELEECPKTVAAALRYPPMGPASGTENARTLRAFARVHGERIWPQGLTVLPTFHADDVGFYIAGQNTCKRINVVRYGKTKDGKQTVTLEIPDGFDVERLKRG